MLRPVSKLNEYKYALSDITISVAGLSDRYMIRASTVKEISIIHNYIDNIIPIIKISANVEKAVYKLLTASETDISMAIILHKYINNSDIKAKELVFNETFSLLNEYDIQPNEMKMFDSDKFDPSSGKTTSVHTDQLVEASFYLINKEKLIKYRTVKSHFLQNVTLTDTIALLFSERGFGSLLMNVIPNDYLGNIYIPSYNLLASLQFLNNRYGIFNTNYIFYMDIIETYLLNKNNLGTAVRENKPANVNLYSERHGTNESVDIGSIIENDAYIVNMTKPPDVIRLGSYIDFIEGSKIMGIDTNDNLINLDGVFERPMQVFNSKIPKQLQAASNEAKCGLVVGLIGIDIDLVSPNLRFNTIIDPDYNIINPTKGLCRLTSANIKLINSGSDNFDIAASLELH